RDLQSGRKRGRADAPSRERDQSVAGFAGWQRLFQLDGGLAAGRGEVVMRVALGVAPTAQAQEVKTIRPGMSESEVRAAWGEPVTSRTTGDYAYLFYQNGCLRACGTYDVVILQGGQVVDAIARGKEHQY